MYIEYKGEQITGPARIGKVTFSKSGKSIYYRGQTFYGIGKLGKSNYRDAETGEHYWISGCKKDGSDRLYSGTVEIDDDVREEYWTVIRQQPEKKNQRRIRGVGKYSLG